MAVDISKFGVPLNSQKLGMLHPKQGYRFRVIFMGFGFDVDTRTLTREVQTVTRPNRSQQRIAVHSYNTTAYIAGKHEWQTLTVTLRDDISNGVVSAIGQQIQKQVNHYEQTSAVAGANYKFDMEIHSLDGTNAEELEAWSLTGCWLESTEYPEGSYESSEALTVSMTVSFDEAVQVAGANTNGGNAGGEIWPNIPSPGGSSSIA